MKVVYFLPDGTIDGAMLELEDSKAAQCKGALARLSAAETARCSCCFHSFAVPHAQMMQVSRFVHSLISVVGVGGGGGGHVTMPKTRH